MRETIKHLEKPFSLLEFAVRLWIFGNSEASTLLLCCWLVWVRRNRKTLRVLGSPYLDPRLMLINSLQVIKRIVFLPRMLVSGGIGREKEGELPLDGYVVYISPASLQEDLVTFVHECCHALLYKRGLWQRKFHNEYLIEEYSQIVVARFREVVLDELAYACGGYQLWFDDFGRLLGRFRIDYISRRKEECSYRWYYKRTGHWLVRRDESPEISCMVQHRPLVCST